MLPFSRRVPLKRQRPCTVFMPSAPSPSRSLIHTSKPCFLSGTPASSMATPFQSQQQQQQQRQHHQRFSSLCRRTSLVNDSTARNPHQRLSSLSSTIITRNGSFTTSDPRTEDRATKTAAATKSVEDDDAERHVRQEQRLVQLMRNRNSKDDPVGSWTSKSWYQELETLRSWTYTNMNIKGNDGNSMTGRQQKQQGSRVPSSLGVEQACRLLEGLVQEYKYHHHTKLLDSGSDHAPPAQEPAEPASQLLSLSWGEHEHPTHTLHAVVQCWFDCYRNGNSRTRIETPVQMCAYIERVTGTLHTTTTPTIAAASAIAASSSSSSLSAPGDVPEEDSICLFPPNVQTWSLLLEAALLRRDDTSTTTFCESLLHRMVLQASSSSSSSSSLLLQSSTIPATTASSALQQSSPSATSATSAPSTSTAAGLVQCDTGLGGQTTPPYPVDSDAPDTDHDHHPDLMLLFPQSFNKVMTAYVQHEKDVAGAERCLSHLQDLYLSSSTQGPSPSTTLPSTSIWTFRPQPESYSIVIAGWAKQGNARQAERVLQSMMDLAHTNTNTNANADSGVSSGVSGVQDNNTNVDFGLMPTKTHFESCLNGWRNSAAGQRVAGQRAELLLLKMDELHKEMGLDTQPCIKSIGKVLQCWVDSKHQDAAARSEAILRLMREHYFDSASDAKTLAEGYANVLRAWSLSGVPEAPEKTEILFRELLEQVGERNISAKILQKCYTAMMTAWTRSGRQDAATAAQAIFDDMDRKCRNGECDFLPGNAMYNSLLHAWARAGNGIRAEQILAQMDQDYRAGNENAKPDTKAFNSVILAWSKSEDASAADRAEHVFLIMTEQTATSIFGHLQPDVVTFNALLSSLNAAGSYDNDNNVTVAHARARRGKQYLQQLKKLYTAGDSSCRPNAVTYTQAIMLWSNVKSPESVERAQVIFNEMHRVVVLNAQTVRSVGLAYEAFIKVLQNSNLPDKHERVQYVRDELKRLGSGQRKR